MHVSEHSKRIPLVFVPGVKGSSLQDAEGRKVWITPRQAFGQNPRHCQALDLPLHWYEVNNDPEDPDGHLRYRQMTDGIQPRKPISKVAKFHIYGHWLKVARKIDRPYYEFAYDWRRDLNEASHNLIKFLEPIVAQHGPVQIVCHSMGGLVVFAALNDPKTVKMFHNVIFAGTPFSQEIGFLFDMHVGVPNGFNNQILDPKVLFTCASGSVFYPFHDNPKVFIRKDQVQHERRRPEPDEDHTTFLSDEEIRHHKQFLEDHPDLTVFDIDFYDPNDWREFKIGIFSMEYQNMNFKLPPGARQEDLEAVINSHMQHAMYQGVHFRNRIKFNPKVEYPPMAMLHNTTHETFARVLRDGPKSVRGFDFETLPKTTGDIRVSAASTTLPRGVPFDVYETENEHAYLLDDPIVWKIMDRMNDFNGDPEWFHRTKITFVRKQVDGKPIVTRHHEHVIRVL
ncbi:hypothetical protein PROFUN_00697 [Planoprotostelium fungivorum]|uniref:Lecithin:cholesterol acyltransferase n=1 Tax=Planoprotostelium fungivorum TaxID=1890364 RepID=A0A2P6NU72_9EUKA|nr:hypothetical protein PROFUN_00697 [Planoprotostelium fungivorum]